ncbi:MAG: hypothetical protein KQI81_09000 [Deltaproteobacteria bacterium]|nr:hypothetical protein [Deltaproteobacteria bacterium]
MGIPGGNTFPLERVIDARIEIEDSHVRFDYFPISETNLYWTDYFVSYADNGTLYRVALKENMIWYCEAIVSPLDTFTATWHSVPGFSVRTGSNLAIEDGYLFYQDEVTGAVKRILVSSLPQLGSKPSDPETVGPAGRTETVQIAAISATECYVFPMSETGSDRFTIEYCVGSTSSAWDGKYYDGAVGVPHVAAYREANTDYVYFTDALRTRTFYIKRRNGFWSDVRTVLPIDVLDDMSSFEFTGISSIDGLPILCGRLRRSYGNIDMLVYMIGPEEFTAGRDLFIDTYVEQSYRGANMVKVGNYLVYDFPFGRYIAKGTSAVDINNPDVISSSDELLNFNLSKTSNEPATFSCQLKNSFSPLLVSGAEIKVYVSINEFERYVGKFNIDGIVLGNESFSKPTMIGARSSCMKKLAQWKSDAPYDYWSQTKLTANPKDLSDVVITTGLFEEDTLHDGLKQRTLNEDGVLYVNAKATRNGMIRADFIHNSMMIKPRFGLALNYYRETKGQAAERLGISSDEVEETDYGHSGIFALVEDSDRGFVLNLYYVHDNTWSLQAQATNVPLMVATNFSVMMKFKDGHIRVYYSSGTAQNWVLAINHVFDHETWMPWKRAELVKGDAIGRGAILLNGITNTTTSFPFSIDDDYIPLLDNTGFPTVDELPPYLADRAKVNVGGEIINYASRSRNELITGLKASPGEVFISNDKSKEFSQIFADLRTRNYIRQTMTWPATRYVTAVSVYVNRLNYPDDGLFLWLSRDVSSTKPVGTRFVKASVLSEDIPENGGWITFLFDKPTEGKSGDFIVMTRGVDAAHPNALSYYSVGMNSSSPYTGGLCQTFSDNTDRFTTVTGDMLFKMHAAPITPNGSYSIMVETTPELSAMAGYYNNMALYVSAGAGIGNTYRIYDYVWGANVSTFYLEREPIALDLTSEFTICPTLYGLTRTDQMAHGKEKVDWWPDNPSTTCTRVDYFSSNKDKSLADYFEIIGRKAGVRKFYYDYLIEQDIPPAYSLAMLTKNNFLANMQVPYQFSGTIDLEYRGGKTVLRLSSSDVTLIVDGLPQEVIAVSNISGSVLVSSWDEFLSIWANGELIHSFVVPTNDPDNFYFTGTCTQDVFLTVREADIRIDNLLLDTNASGISLINQVIGGRRFYYQETRDDQLRLFNVRKQFLTQTYPASIATSYSETDNNIATRVRLEGGAIHEHIDADAMRQYGNIYYEGNMSEIYTEEDAKSFTLDTFNELILRGKTRTITGPAYIEIEPNEIFSLQLPNKDDSGDVIELINIADLSYDFSNTESEARFDMQITGNIVSSQEV